MILFNVPLVTGKEFYYISKLLVKMKFCGDAEFTHLCNKWFENVAGAKKTLLTTSGTHALELSAILADVKEGDEIIMPSYTFVSTANAFALRGAKIVFIDIRPDTMNLDENLIEDAITENTRAIVPVHYAGVACEMDAINAIAHKHNLLVIEDAAQGVMAKYKGKHLGTIGELGAYSFHETKNYQCGEGGAIVINEPRFIERAEIIREKGTDRSKFLRGEVDKYTWVDIGSSYLPSDLSAAFLYAQLEIAEDILKKRMNHWKLYIQLLSPLAEAGRIDLPRIPQDCDHNAHMFYIKTKDLDERSRLMSYLKRYDIQSVFHYIPLHSAKAGKRLGRFDGEDKYTTRESERLLRLPLYYELDSSQISFVCEKVKHFYLS